MIKKENITFYYDETNNIRKLYLTRNKENYLNCDNNPFILGGVIVKRVIPEVSINELRKQLGIQKNQNEIKFKDVCKGGFEKGISSKKLNYFFHWLLENDILVHAEILDITNWSLIDILESSHAINIYNAFFFKLKIYDRYPLSNVKMTLKQISKTYKKDFYKDLFNLGYPNINQKNRHKFIDLLLKYIKKYRKSKKYLIDTIDIRFVDSLAIIVENFKQDNSDGFTFLDREDPFLLIKNLSIFYYIRILEFKIFNNILDEEQVISKCLEEPQFSDLNKLDCYSFENSKNNFFIQLSDVFVGFLKMFFEYLESTSICDSYKKIEKLTDLEKENLFLFFKLYKNSIVFNPKAFHFIYSNYELNQFDLFKDKINTMYSI